MNLQADIDKLKATLLQATDFGVAWNEFFDLARQPHFIAKSRKTHLNHLEPVLHEVGVALTSDHNAKLKALAILRYANTDFYHGPLVCGSSQGTFMYFHKQGAGMAALLDKASGRLNFCRINLAMVSSPHCFTAPPPNTERPSVH